jgi:hypothetical protein
MKEFAGVFLPTLEVSEGETHAQASEREWFVIKNAVSSASFPYVIPIELLCSLSKLWLHWKYTGCLFAQQLVLRKTADDDTSVTVHIMDLLHSLHAVATS